jgi:O-antigen ligase/tetratricopeptide (TPR) repeat protein
MKKIAHHIAIATLFLIPIFPLIVANSLFFPFITGKAFYFRLLVEVAFASWIILAFLDVKYRPRLTSMTIAVSIFALVTLVADLLGVNPLRSIWSNFERMEGWLVIFHLWMFYITAVSLFGSGESGRTWWYRWLNMSVGVAVIVGVYGLFQLFGWAAIHQGTTRIDASLGNAAYMAVYMLFHAFIAAYLYFAHANTVKSIAFPQWVYAFLALLFGFLVFETATRGTILGLIGGILLALALYSLFGKREKRKYRLGSGIAIGVIILIGVVFWLNRSATFIQNSEVLSRMANISLQENKTQARGYIWPMAIEGWQERPILGWGQENFNYIFNSHYEPAMWAHEQWFDRAHSVFLDWLTASGLLGFLSYLSLYVFCILAIWKSSLSIREKSVFTGLLAGYAIHNIFVFDNIASYVFFFAILGFSGSLKEGKVISWFGTKPVRTDAVEYIAAPIVLILLVIGLYMFNVRPLQANTRLLTALGMCSAGRADVALFEKSLSVGSSLANQEVREQLLACTPMVLNGQYPGTIKQAFLTLSQKEIEAQMDVAPNDARIHVLAGFFMNSIGNYPEAEKYLSEALRLSPGKQSIMIPLAIAYANTGKGDEGLSLMKEAYESAPEHTQLKAVYASMFVIAGKEAEGRALFPNEPELFENVTVAQVYVALKQYPKAIALYKKLIVEDPQNVELRGSLAQTQLAAGMTFAAIETLRAIAVDYPEYKQGIDAAIKQVQAGK